MIAQLKGKLARTGADYVVIDVNGVGYKVHVPLSIMAQLPPAGEDTELLIHTSVKEDSITLFGFLEESEQRLFELVLGVSGIGPKLALNILSVLPVGEIVGAISRDDYRQLSRVPGVGMKTAQRLALELKDKLSGAEWVQTGGRQAQPELRAIEDAIEGLVSLGYNRGDAKTAVEEAVKDVSNKLDAGVIVRQALRFISRK